MHALGIFYFTLINVIQMNKCSVKAGIDGIVKKVIIYLISAGLVLPGALWTVSRPVCYSTLALLWIIYNAFGSRKRQNTQSSSTWPETAHHTGFTLAMGEAESPDKNN